MQQLPPPTLKLSGRSPVGHVALIEPLVLLLVSTLGFLGSMQGPPWLLGGLARGNASTKEVVRGGCERRSCEQRSNSCFCKDFVTVVLRRGPERP